MRTVFHPWLVRLARLIPFWLAPRIEHVRSGRRIGVRIEWRWIKDKPAERAVKNSLKEMSKFKLLDPSRN